MIERRANRLRILLRRHDPGRTGRISVNGLQQGLAALRYSLSEEQVRSFLTMAKQRDLERGIDYERVSENAPEPRVAVAKLYPCRAQR